MIYGTNHQENRTYNYDATGNLLSTTYPNAPDALAHTYAQYDFLNRVVNEVSAGQSHAYDYDKAGNRLQTTYRGGRTLVCTYDALNRLSSCTETLAGSGSAARITRYLYDLDGHTRYKQLPGGVLEERRWDTRGRCNYQATSPPPATVVWPPVPVSQGGAFITHHWYHFDNVGNVRLIVESTDAAGNASRAIPARDILNTYDGTHRLLEESITIHATALRVETTGYSYDKAGNRIGMTRNYGSALENGVTTYLYGDPLSTDATVAGPSNQVRVMLRPGGTSVQYKYDLYGCRNRRWVNAGAPVVTTPVTGVDGFEYDRENRLKLAVVAAAAPPGVVRVLGQHTYRYDARTRRVVRVAPGKQTNISFSGGLSVQEYEVPPAGSSSGGSSSSSIAAVPDVEYIRGSDYGGGIGGILYTLRGGVASCQHYNHRGDVIAKTAGTTAATVEWTAAYTAFGNRPEEHGTNPDPHRANTKEEDGTGLLNEGHRYRCLETGMFITRDPAGFIDGPNLYGYVRQNPWTSFDSEGLWGWGTFFEAMAVAVVVAAAVAVIAVAAPAIVAAGVASYAATVGATAATAATLGVAAGSVTASAITVTAATAAVVVGVVNAPETAAYVSSAVTNKETEGSWSSIRDSVLDDDVQAFSEGADLPDGEQERRAGTLLGGALGGKLGASQGASIRQSAQVPLVIPIAEKNAVDLAAKNVKKGSAGAMISPNFKILTGRSEKAIPKNTEDSGIWERKITKEVSETYQKVNKKTYDSKGNLEKVRTSCAEAHIASKAQAQGIKIKGGVSATYNITPRYTRTACDRAYSSFLKKLKIKDAHGH